MRSACWLPSGYLLTGAEDGSVVTWRSGKAIAKVQAHERGNMSRRPDGTPAHHGVRAILLHTDQECAPQPLLAASSFSLAAQCVAVGEPVVLAARCTLAM